MSEIEILKHIWKQGERKETKTKIVLAAGLKLNSFNIFQALTDAGTSHEKFRLVNFEAVNYCRLKGNIRIKISNKCKIKRDILIEHGK